MGEIFSTCTVYDCTLSSGVKELIIETPNTADNTDTIDVTLADYGIKKILTILGHEHTTDNSVVVTTAPTTSVSSGVLTIDIGGSNTDNIYVFTIRGTC